MRLISLCCVVTLAACVPAVLLAQDGRPGSPPICARCYVVCSLRDPCRVAHRRALALSSASLGPPKPVTVW